VSDKTLRINHPGDGDWIMERVDGVFNPRTDHSLAVARDGEIIGGVVFCGYTGAAITMHMAGTDTHWGTRDFIWSVYAYAFHQLGVRKVIGLVPAGNTRALEIDLKMGFRVEARITGVYADGGDLLILSMTRAECRWLRIGPKHNRCEKAA
jgi:RimJ/RimL family protein N-acetyltransferase